MITSYPVPTATEKPLGPVTQILSLAAGGGEDVFSGGFLPQLLGRAYGGQVAVQGMLAAAIMIGDDGDSERLPCLVHVFLMRGGQSDTPIASAVKRLHDGWSFSQRYTAASQEDMSTLMIFISFQREQEDADLHVEALVAPRLEDLMSALEIFHTVDHPVARFLGRTTTFSLRYAEGNLYLRLTKGRAGRQYLWMHSRSRTPGQASQTVRRALLVYACDRVVLEPVLRSQGLSWCSEGMSLAILDHVQWFHHDVDMGDWLLYARDLLSSQGSRGMVCAQVSDSSGRLVPITAQEGMVRMPIDPRSDGGSGCWRIYMGEGDDGSIIPG